MYHPRSIVSTVTTRTPGNLLICDGLQEERTPDMFTRGPSCHDTPLRRSVGHSHRTSCPVEVPLPPSRRPLLLCPLPRLRPRGPRKCGASLRPVLGLPVAVGDVPSPLPHCINLGPKISGKTVGNTPYPTQTHPGVRPPSVPVTLGTCRHFRPSGVRGGSLTVRIRRNGIGAGPGLSRVGRTGVTRGGPVRKWFSLVGPRADVRSGIRSGPVPPHLCPGFGTGGPSWMLFVPFVYFIHHTLLSCLLSSPVHPFPVRHQSYHLSRARPGGVFL